MSYIGVEPVPKASRILTEGVLASSSQTISVPGGFTPDNIYVYINGSRLAQDDYDDSDGFTVDLGEVVPAGTEYVIEEIRSFEIPNHYTKDEIRDAQWDFNNMPTVGGDPMVESGSNADGEWTRWADGTQVVTTVREFPLAELSIAQIGGTGQWYSDVNNFTFPATFLNTNYAVSYAVGAARADACYLGVGSAGGWSTSSIVLFIISARQMVNPVDYAVSIVGRWK